MSFGSLSKAQAEYVEKVVRGRVVFDLGAGDLGLAYLLVGLGAERVIAIDRDERMAAKGLKKPQIDWFHMSHDQYLAQNPDQPIDVAFMSWPYNMYDHGLLKIAQRAKTVVYLGQCTGGTACGFPQLFQHFLTRKLEAHVPERPNTLIIVGELISEPREATLEEKGGMDHAAAYSFEGKRMWANS